MKKRQINILSIFLALVLVTLGIFYTRNEAGNSRIENYHVMEGKFGSAQELEGNIVVVSVFASDINYKWNMESEVDQIKIENIKEYLKTATDYLTAVAVDYGKEANFICDYDENEGLQYFADFYVDTIVQDSCYAEESMNDFISNNIVVDKILRKYKADSIIYFMFVNTDEDATGYSCTRNYYEGMPYPYEIVFLYNMDGGHINCPAVYAHEMLHAFGAPDLYYKDTEYGFTDEFVEYISENMGNDIMFYCSDLETGEYVYDRITNEVSELDAYYVGLTETSEIVERYGLGKSQH